MRASVEVALPPCKLEAEIGSSSRNHDINHGTDPVCMPDEERSKRVPTRPKLGLGARMSSHRCRNFRHGFFLRRHGSSSSVLENQ